MHTYIYTHGGALSVMLIVVENGIGNLSSNPARNCVSLRTDTFEKSETPSVSLSMGKLKGKLGSLALVRQSVSEKEFKPTGLLFKTDLESYPSRSGAGVR